MIHSPNRPGYKDAVRGTPAADTQVKIPGIASKTEIELRRRRARQR